MGDKINIFLNQIPVPLGLILMGIVTLVIGYPIIKLAERYPKQFYGTLAVIFIIIGFISKTVILFIAITLIFFIALIKLNN